MNILSKKIYVFFILAFLFESNLSIAQRNNTHWFGDYSLINFGLVGDEIIDTVYTNLPQLNKDGNTSVATHPITGELLFYSDGQKIFNRVHEEMLGGSLLPTSSTANIQRTAVSFRPGADAATSAQERYFLFVNNGNINAFPINLSRTEGGGTTKFQNGIVEGSSLPVAIKTTSAMTVISNGVQEWLISQNTDNAKLYLHKINPDQITIVDSLETSGSTKLYKSFKYNRENKLIVANPQKRGEDIDFIKFDDLGDGQITESLIPKEIKTNNNSVFTSEWLNDSILYVSYDKSLKYYNIKNPQDLTSGGTTIALPTHTLARSFDIKRGPNNKLYHLYQISGNAEITMGRITPPGFPNDDPTTPIDESKQNLFRYEENINRRNYQSKFFSSLLQLKNIEPNDIEIKLSYTYEVATGSTSILVKNCQFNKLKSFVEVFYKGEAIHPDESQWNVEGQLYNNQVAINHLLENSGTLTIDYTARINNQVFQESQRVTIEESKELQINPQDTTICPGIYFPLKPQDSEQQQSQSTPTEALYLWNTGETTNSIAVGFTSSDINPANLPTFDKNLSGEYKVWKFSESCIQTATSNVTIYGEEELRTDGKLPPTPSPIGKWYFGNKAAIDFNAGNLPIDNSEITAENGVESVFDSKGNILFYTNGVKLWTNDDAIKKNNLGNGSQHELLVDDLDGNIASKHGVKIVQAPNEKNYYYIFTSQLNKSDQYQISYSLVNTRGVKVNSNGQASFGISIEKKNIILFNKATERLGISSGTGNKRIVSHEFGTNRLVMFDITENGIIGPTYSTGGPFFKLNNAESNFGEIEFTENNKLAVPYSESIPLQSKYKNSIILYDIDTSSNSLPIKPVNLELKNTDTKRIYGLESKDSTLLATLHGINSEIIEIDIDIDNHTHKIVNATFKKIITLGNTLLGDISTAPDNVIYVSKDKSGNLGSLSRGGNGYTYTQDQLNLGSNTSSLALPSYRLSPDNGSGTEEPTLSLEGYCLGDTTFAYATKKTKIDEISWDFGVSSTPSALLFQKINTTKDTVKLLYEDKGNASYKITANFTRCKNNTILPANILSDTKSDSIHLNGAYHPVLPLNYCNVQTIPISIRNNAGVEFSLDNLPAQVNIEVENKILGQVFTSPIDIDPIKQQGSWEVRVSSDGKCTKSATANVFDQSPKFNLVSKAFCVGDSSSSLEAHLISKLDPSLGDIYKYTWKKNGNIIPVNGSDTTIISSPNDKIEIQINTEKKDSSEYSLTIYQNGESCKTSDTTQVKINQPTPSNLNNNEKHLICLMDPPPFTTLDPGIFQHYEWTNQTTGSSYSSPKLEIDNISKVGNFLAKFSDTHGCITEVNFSVFEECNAKIALPNAFTPEHTKNSVFRIAFANNVSTEDFEISIFNRWGVLIYYSNDFNKFKNDKSDLKFTQNGWDGRDQNGKEMPAGSYAYVLKYKSSASTNSKKFIKRGSILLIR